MEAGGWNRPSEERGAFMFQSPIIFLLFGPVTRKRPTVWGSKKKGRHWNAAGHCHNINQEGVPGVRVSWGGRAMDFYNRSIPGRPLEERVLHTSCKQFCHHLPLQQSLTRYPASKWGRVLEATWKSKVSMRPAVNSLWKPSRDPPPPPQCREGMHVCNLTRLLTIKWKTKWPFPLETEPKWNR